MGNIRQNPSALFPANQQIMSNLRTEKIYYLTISSDERPYLNMRKTGTNLVDNCCIWCPSYRSDGIIVVLMVIRFSSSEEFMIFYINMQNGQPTEAQAIVIGEEITLDGIQFKFETGMKVIGYTELRPKANVKKYSNGKCPICLEEEEQMKDIIITDCGHMFCSGCILPAIQQHGVCPCCRKALTVQNLSKPTKRSNRLAKKKRICYKF